MFALLTSDARVLPVIRRRREPQKSFPERCRTWIQRHALPAEMFGNNTSSDTFRAAV